MTVRGELRAASPPARHDVDGCKKCLSLEVKASFRHRREGGAYFEPALETHARLGENAAKTQADLAELASIPAEPPLSIGAW